MITELKAIIYNNAFFITVYAVLTTIIIFIKIRDKRKKRNKYMILKEENIKLPFYERKYVNENDQFIQQLWDDVKIREMKKWDVLL